MLPPSPGASVPFGARGFRHNDPKKTTTVRVEESADEGARHGDLIAQNVGLGAPQRALAFRMRDSSPSNASRHGQRRKSQGRDRFFQSDQGDQGVQPYPS